MKQHIECIDRNIREASAWCRLLLEENSGLTPRSAVLSPGQSLTLSDDPCMLVDEVCARRKRLLAERNCETTAEIGNGKLLLYYPYLTLSDGAAEIVSEGFFDANNEPAWDVWVFCETNESLYDAQDYGTCLLNWIPNGVIELVEPGIHINPERCLEWVSESNHPFAKELKRSGLRY